MTPVNTLKFGSVDLSPLVIDRVENSGIVLKAKTPFEVTPTLDEESAQYPIVTDEDLDLHACGSTREELAEDVARHLVFARRAYAKEESRKLTSKANELARILRDRFEKVADAP